jgi:ABC-type sugar transport system substrate-binding protein
MIKRFSKIGWIVLVTLLSLALVVLPACTTTPAEEEEEEVPIIGVCLPALDNPLMMGLRDAFVNTFSDEYNVMVASADGNPLTQATQIENYATMGAKFMFVMLVEANSARPKLIAAREAGVLILVGGGDPGEDARDACMKMDQFLSGEYAAWLAKNWTDVTFPGAAAESIETAIFCSSLNPEAIDRTNGLKMISEPYLKDSTGAYINASGTPISDAHGNYLSGKSESDRVTNPVYCPAVNVTNTPAAEMFVAGMTAMQNILTTNPNTKLVIAYASDGGNGASKAMMDEWAKGPGVSVIEDLSKVAVFGVGALPPEIDAVVASSVGNGTLRGCVSFGGLDLPERTVALAAKMLNGESYPAVTLDALALVTAKNGPPPIIVPVPSGGVIGQP